MKAVRYTYTVIDRKGALHKGFIQAIDIDSVKTRLTHKQWMIVELNQLEEVFQKSIHFKNFELPVRKQTLSSKQILGFTQEVASLLNSGISLIAALRILLEKEESSFVGKILSTIVHGIEEGISFSDALVLSGVDWGDSYICAIQAADRSGRLLAIMDMLQSELERKSEFENKLRSALIYPAFVLILSLAVVLMLLIFVVPQFSGMLSDLTPNATLPLGTRLVLSLSSLLCDAGWLLFILLPVVCLIFAVLCKTTYVRRYFGATLDRLPFIGTTLRLMEIERILYTLHVLLASGTHMVEALNRVQLLSGSIVIHAALLRIHQRILEGEELSSAVGVESVFPLWLKDNLRIGEQSGSLDAVLKKSAYAVRLEIDRKLKLVTTLIEPLLVLGLAVVIGGLVICLFWPILTVIQQMSEF